LPGRNKVVRAIIVITIAALILGLLYSVTYTQMATRIPSDASGIVSWFKIIVYSTATGEAVTYNLQINAQFLKVWHYHEGGTMFSVFGRQSIMWQLIIGAEDELYDPLTGVDLEYGSGDFADTIIKIARLNLTHVYFEVGCLGAYRKQVFFGSELKLDTNVARWTYWTREMSPIAV